jgi:hypothetical protein
VSPGVVRIYHRHQGYVPSGQPSIYPTRHPTVQPSSRPSRQPTSQPSRLPSGQPSSSYETTINPANKSSNLKPKIISNNKKKKLI